MFKREQESGCVDLFLVQIARDVALLNKFFQRLFRFLQRGLGLWIECVESRAVHSITTSTIRFTRAASGDFSFVHNLEQIARSHDLTRKNVPSKGKKGATPGNFHNGEKI